MTLKSLIDLDMQLKLKWAAVCYCCECTNPFISNFFLLILLMHHPWFSSFSHLFKFSNVTVFYDITAPTPKKSSALVGHDKNKVHNFVNLLVQPLNGQK